MTAANASLSLSRFEHDLRMALKAARTIQVYCGLARRFVDFVGIDPGEASQDAVRWWVDHLRLQPIKAATLRVHYSALKFLFEKTLGQPEKVAFISMPHAKAPLPKILSPEEVARVLDGFISVKYRTLFTLIYATGMRINEARLLQTDDINAMQQVIHVRNGKGGRERLVPMDGRLYARLRAYYKYERPPAPWMFTSKSGKPICPDTARRALLCAAAMAGIGKVVTPHMLRHAFATNLLEHGTDLRKIQAVLGHESIRSTVIYTHVTTRLIAEIRSPMQDLPD